MTWLYVYLLPGMIKRFVWRRVATEWPRLWSKHMNGDGRALLPSYPHSLYPDKGKPLTRSDCARQLWGLSPLRSFHSSLALSSLFSFSVSLSLLHNLTSVFGGVLHKSLTALPPGNWGSLIEKEIRNENSHSFSGLCFVKERKCTRGKKTKCTREWVKEIGHVLKTKWKRSRLTSLPASELSLMIFLCFFS